MNSRTFERRRGQRGMTLMEVLAAILIFTIVILVALGLYQVANRAYLSTDSATIQQQNVRFAIDRMLETLRNAGADHNTLGSRTLPDEQIEGAWESAVFVRGDFDNSRETALESTTYPIVTVGNDEIVGYVLRKPGGDAANPISLTMKIDLTPATGRDATISGTTVTNEETATVKVAASSLAEQTNPPYQLTRVTFNAAGAPQYEVIADDIFRMSFAYLDSTGTATVPTFGGADAQRTDRAKVRQLDVNLIGMANRADFGYTDTVTYSPAENADTKNRRKFSLTEHVVPPNLGVVGHRHNLSPPTTLVAPTSITACTGHCQYFHLSWPDSASGGVTIYKVHVTAPASGADVALDQTVTAFGLEYDYKQPTTTVRAYTFEVAAASTSVVGTFSPSVTATSSNATESVPGTPLNVAAAADATLYAIDVNWNEVLTNTSAITSATCTTSPGGATSAPQPPWDTKAVDLKEYKVYRVRYDGSTTGSFTPSVTNEVDSQVLVAGTLYNTAPLASTFVDKTAAPCSSYFYRTQACDLCGVTGGYSAAMTSPASFAIASTIKPAAPTGLTGTYTTSGGNYAVNLTWSPVVQTSTGTAAATARYTVQRYRSIAGAAYVWEKDLATVWEATTTTDTAPQTLVVAGVTQTVTYRYYVIAQYDCSPTQDSAQSNAFDLTCTPSASNTVTATVPALGTDVSRPNETGFAPVLTMGGTGWTGASVTISGTTYSQTISGSPSGTTYTFPFFDASALADGTYTLIARGIVGSCQTTPITVPFTLSTGTCGLQIASYQWVSTNGNGAYTQLQFRIQNTCDSGSTLTVNGLQFAWTGVVASDYLSSITYNGTTYKSGLTSSTGAQNTMVLFTGTNKVDIAPATTTPFDFVATFSNNMTNDGGHGGSSVPGKFTSIKANISAPAAAAAIDELISGSPIP